MSNKMYFLFSIQFLYAAGPENEEKLFNLCNKYREENGEPPHRRNSALDKAAKMQAEYCAKNNILTNFQERDSKTCTHIQRVKRCGFKTLESSEIKCSSVIEKPDGVLNLWKHDPFSRYALLYNFEEAGYASAKAENGRIYWFSVYATKIKEHEKRKYEQYNQSEDGDEDEIEDVVGEKNNSDDAPPKEEPKNDQKLNQNTKQNNLDPEQVKKAAPNNIKNLDNKPPSLMERRKNAYKKSFGKLGERKKKRELYDQ